MKATEEKQEQITLTTIVNKLSQIKDMIDENYATIKQIGLAHPDTDLDYTEDETPAPGTIIGNINHRLDTITTNLNTNHEYLQKIKQWTNPE